MFATTPPSSLRHTSPGAQVWGNQANLMRTIKGQDGIQTFIYMNPTDPDDPQNDTLMISGADLQGGSGLDPDYITLANNQITHLKPTTVTSLSADSIGIGSGGMACFGDLTVGIAGNGTLYANGGLEATTMTVAGVGTVSTLNVNNDVTCNHATSTSFIANKNLTLGQDGDEAGGTRLHLRNRSGERGMTFETINSISMADSKFKHSNGER